MDHKRKFEEHGFTGGWVARSDMPPLTEAQAAAHARRTIPHFERRVLDATENLGAEHPMTVRYRELLERQRGLAG